VLTFVVVYCVICFSVILLVLQCFGAVVSVTVKACVMWETALDLPKGCC